MNQFVVEARIKDGRLELFNLPFSEATEVKVFVIPKADLAKMSFLQVQNLPELTHSSTGAISSMASQCSTILPFANLSTSKTAILFSPIDTLLRLTTKSPWPITLKISS